MTFVEGHDYKSKLSLFLLPYRKAAYVRGKCSNISFGRENVTGQWRKVLSVNVGLIQQHIPGEVRGSGSGWSRWIHWYDFIISLSSEQGAGWLAGLSGSVVEADGANGIRMSGPHLSVVMAGWQALMDRWSWGFGWQSRSVDELWNETDIQKLWAAQT